MKTLLACGAAAVAIVGLAPAIAQVPQTGAQAHAVHGEARAAKVHSRTDVQAKVAKHFGRLDADRDGFVTRAETDAARAQMRERIGERMNERHADMFERMDADKNGSISRAEFNAMHAKRADRPRGGDRLRRVAGMRTMHGTAMLGGRMFDMADADKDGRVSLQEAQAAALRHFDMADSNRDGQVTREERRQMRQRMINERRPG